MIRVQFKVFRYWTFFRILIHCVRMMGIQHSFSSGTKTRLLQLQMIYDTFCQRKRYVIRNTIVGHYIRGPWIVPDHHDVPLLFTIFSVFCSWVNRKCCKNHIKKNVTPPHLVLLLMFLIELLFKMYWIHLLLELQLKVVLSTTYCDLRRSKMTQKYLLCQLSWRKTSK